MQLFFGSKIKYYEVWGHGFDSFRSVNCTRSLFFGRACFSPRLFALAQLSTFVFENPVHIRTHYLNNFTDLILILRIVQKMFQFTLLCCFNNDRSERDLQAIPSRSQ